MIFMDRWSFRTNIIVKNLKIVLSLWPSFIEGIFKAGLTIYIIIDHSRTMTTFEWSIFQATDFLNLLIFVLHSLNLTHITCTYNFRILWLLYKFNNSSSFESNIYGPELLTTNCVRTFLFTRAFSFESSPILKLFIQHNDLYHLYQMLLFLLDFVYCSQI